MLTLLMHRTAVEQDFRKLDSSVKRNTALIKKLRLVNKETKEALLDEIRRTNQSKVICLLVSFYCWQIRLLLSISALACSTCKHSQIAEELWKNDKPILQIPSAVFTNLGFHIMRCMVF